MKPLLGNYFYEDTMESFDLRDLVEDEVEHNNLDKAIVDKAIRYIKDNERLLQMLDLIVAEAISCC